MISGYTPPTTQPPTANNDLAESYNGIAGPKADDFLDNLLEKAPGSTKFWNYFYTLFMIIFVILGTSVVILLAVFFHNRVIFPIDSSCTTGSKDIVIPSNVISDFWKKCSSFSETKYLSSFHYSLQEINCMKSESYGRALNLMSVPNVKRSIVDNVIKIADQYLAGAPTADSCSKERSRILAIQTKYKNYLSIIDKGGDVELPKFFKTFVYQKSLEQALSSNNALQKDSLNDVKYSWISTVPETINEQKEQTVYGLALSNKFENLDFGIVRRVYDDSYGSRMWVSFNETVVPLFKGDSFDLLTNFVVADSTNITAFYELLDSQIQNPALKNLISQNNTNLVVTYTDMNAELMLLNLARINSKDRSNVMAEYSMMLAKYTDGTYEQRTKLTWGSSKEPTDGILQRLTETSFQSSFVLQGFSKQSVFDQDFLNFVVRDGSDYIFYTTDVYCKDRVAKTNDGVQVSKCNILKRELTYSTTPEYGQISAQAIFDPANQFYVGLKLDSDDDDDDIYEELANGDAEEFHF